MASAEWSGVIEIVGEELDCRLFSATGRARPLPLRLVHARCRTTLEEEKEEQGKPEVEEEKREEPPPAEAREQLYCPKCAMAIKADEIGRVVDSGEGFLDITEAELASLQFETGKRVRAEIVRADDPAIAAIGIARRLYLFPKPASLPGYANVFHVLKETGLAGFLPDLVIKKRPAPAVLRLTVIPEAVFGAGREALTVSVLEDTDKLKDPAAFPDYPREIPSLDAAALAKPMAEAQAAARPLDPERCVNPRRKRLKTILLEKMKRKLA